MTPTVEAEGVRLRPWFGEAVIDEVDVDDRSCSFRIALSASARDRRGVGTTVTRLVVDHAFSAWPDLHRLELEVSTSTRAPSPFTARSGSSRKGDDATLCGGATSPTTPS